jgi:hypothetical protein
MLCALMLSAVAAQGANAETKGTTIVTCKSGPGNVGSTFSDQHCKVPGTGFGHYEVAPETTTELIGSNITTGSSRSIAVLNSTQSGVAEEIVAGKVEAGTKSAPWVKNNTTGSEHYFTGQGRLRYSEIEVTKPAGKGCKVKGEAIETNELMAGSMSLAEKDPTLNEKMQVRFEPNEGTVFAEFEIEGCSVAALNGLYKVEGAVYATPEGATLTSVEATVTAENTLKVRGQKAGIGGSITIQGKDAVDSVYTPLSVTTVNTP